MKALKIDPGSIDVWTVLKELGYPDASEKLTSLLQQNEMANIRMQDFIREIKKTRSVINEGVELHSQVYDGKDAYGNVETGYGNIEFKSQAWIGQLSGHKRIQYPQHVGYGNESHGKEHGAPQAGGEIM